MIRRNTNQRQIVIDTIANMGHVTTEDLIREISSNYDNISLASIYRNLSILLEDNLIKKIKIGDLEVYETVKKKHYHFKCVKCNEVIDLDCHEINIDLDKLSNSYDQTINDCDIIFYGTCNKCKNK